jgi:hypothetical protein
MNPIVNWFWNVRKGREEIGSKIHEDSRAIYKAFSSITCQCLKLMEFIGYQAERAMVPVSTPRSLVTMLPNIDIPDYILSVLELQRMNETHLVSI